MESLPVSQGAWLETSDLVLVTVAPDMLRFRGIGLQSDLNTLKNGLSANVVPPSGGTGALSGSIEGRVSLGLKGNASQRKLDLIVTFDPEQERPNWAKPGVAAEIEIVLDATYSKELAVPIAAVIQDGLEKVIFRRDPKDKDRVIRMEADLGISDGRWVVVESGMTDGDEVVHHGVYELMLASGSGKQKGGHFHADGTFHAEDH